VPARTSHDVFITALRASYPSEKVVYEWLERLGYEVELLPKTETPNDAERWKHVDGGDIAIKINGLRMRVEVKSPPSFDFSCYEDIPYDPFIVDEAYKIEGMKKLPLAGYVFVNQALNAVLVLKVTTKDHWVKKSIFDTRMQEHADFYVCRKRYAKLIYIGERQ